MVNKTINCTHKAYRKSKNVPPKSPSLISSDFFPSPPSFFFLVFKADNNKILLKQKVLLIFDA